MATIEAVRASVGEVWVRTRDVLHSGRPLIALVAILLITGGHTMNLREMGVSQGWVAEEVYALQSCYLFSLALTILACATLGQRWSGRHLTQFGLVLAVIGAVMNVLETPDPLTTFLLARVVAGVGAGMVIYFAPLILGTRWRVAVAWAFILCPVLGPGFVSAATMTYEASDWRHGFLFEGAASAIGLIALFSMREAPSAPPRAPRGSLAYLPSLAVAAAALIYVLHWGQLHGWLESPDIVAAAFVFAFAVASTLYLAWPQLDWTIGRDNGIRLGLYFFGGVCQFFHGYLMNVYGGSLVNLSSWQRAWLIWPLPVGIATALISAAVALPYLHRRRGRVVLGLPFAIVGVLLVAGGFFLCYRETMEWPYWAVRDVADLNWFSAPGHWELAPGRIMIGLGIGLFMVVMDTQFSPDPTHESTVRTFLHVVQFFGGGLAAGVLVNFMSIGHKIHYSYSAERDAIQAEELVRRGELLGDLLRGAGQPAPHRSAQVLLYRFVNYESDNLVFATIYVAFFLAALGVAGILFGLWLRRKLRRS